jgi:dTDP-4-amino-4,6-dideoxygalactose transaminase
VEDCAQALGADYDGRRAGSWGDFGCFSFYPTKNLGAVGDAGLITTHNPDYNATLRVLRHHGSRQTYLHERVGWNSRLDELQAAVLRVKLRRLEEFNDARRRVAQRYRSKLQGAPLALPAENGRGRHAYHQFTLRSERRDAIREALAREGIASSIFYPLPLHRQPAYEPSNRGLTLPAAEAAAKSVLSLPIHPLLDEQGIDRICACVRQSA